MPNTPSCPLSETPYRDHPVCTLKDWWPHCLSHCPYIREQEDDCRSPARRVTCDDESNPRA